MHIRKRLALLAGQIDEPRQKRFIKGFLKQAFSNDLDVCIFSMYRKYMSTSVREKGESNIYELFDPSDYDGVVILKDSIQIADCCRSIEKRIKDTYKGPVLVIDRESDYFDNIFEDDYAGMSKIVTHMIEEHGYTDIGFVTGRRSHTHAVQRLKAFEDTMKAHGIQVDKDRIFYGDFWYSSGVYAVKEFAASPKGLPQAIICSNDETAIGVCYELDSMGIKVPDEVAVTGYDATSEGQLSPLTVTTCDIPYKKMGEYASSYLFDKINGKTPEGFSELPDLIIGQTCGCSRCSLSSYDLRRKAWQTERMRLDINDVNNMMLRDLLSQTSVAEFCGILYSYVYQIPDIRTFSLCLSPLWKGIDSDPVLHAANKGYPAKMIRALHFDSVYNDGTVDLEDTFEKKDLVPELHEERSTPCSFIFTPFYCEEECFGYAVVSFGDLPVSYNDNYRKWIEDASYGFELLRRTLIAKNYREFIDKISSVKQNVITDKYDNLTDEEKEECGYVSKILDENLLTYVFQPIVKVDTGEIYSYEALMRSTTEKTVSPLSIIRYADILGRIADIEKMTFINVLSLLENDPDIFSDSLIFINSIPGTTMNEKDFLKVTDLLQRFSSQTIVEFTEESELNDIDLQLFKEHLSHLGVKTAIDDFGSGYSNINNLLRYVPNYVKIDRALMTGIDKAPQKQHFVREIIHFCHDNNIMSLAEGVETQEELRTVITMGVDLVQGYYTGRPSPELIKKIDPNIRNEILLYSQEKDDGSMKQIYEAGSSNRISLSLLSKEGATDIVIGDANAVYRDISIIGAPNLKTDIHLRVLSGYTGEITLEDVYFSNIKGRPCIDIEDGSHVTLNLKGNNFLHGNGIRVSPGASVTTEGDGNLTIDSSELHFYGIGNDLKSPHGEICFRHNGKLTLTASGFDGIGVGSGFGGDINILSGQYVIQCSGTKCVGIGSIDAPFETKILNCNLEVDLNANDGVGIGSLNSTTDIYVNKSSVRIIGSGNVMSGMGSIGSDTTKILIEDASSDISMRSNDSTCIGSLNGYSDIICDHIGLRLENAGKHGIAIGGLGKDSSVKLESTDIRVNVHNSVNRDTYASEKDILMTNGRMKFIVNDQEITRELKFTPLT